MFFSLLVGSISCLDARFSNSHYLFQQKNLGEIKQLLKEASLEENRKRELSCAIHVYFKDWLYGIHPNNLSATIF